MSRLPSPSEDSRYSFRSSLSIRFLSLEILGKICFPCWRDDYVVVCCPRVKGKGRGRKDGGLSNADCKKFSYTVILYIQQAIVYTYRIHFISPQTKQERCSELAYEKARSTGRCSSRRTSSCRQEICRVWLLWGSSKACRIGHQQNGGP